MEKTLLLLCDPGFLPAYFAATTQGILPLFLWLPRKQVHRDLLILNKKQPYFILKAKTIMTTVQKNAT